MLFFEVEFFATSQELGQGPKFWWVDPPSDEEIKSLVAILAYRVIGFLKKKGYFQGDIDQAAPEEESTRDELLPEFQAASVQSRIAMGERERATGQEVGQPGVE